MLFNAIDYLKMGIVTIFLFIQDTVNVLCSGSVSFLFLFVCILDTVRWSGINHHLSIHFSRFSAGGVQIVGSV